MSPLPPEATMEELTDQQRAENERVDAARQDHAERLQEHMSHPHTQLNGILNDLRTAPALDVAGRIGQLNSAMQRLIQQIIQHTPPPPEHPGEFQHGQGIDDRQ